MHALLLEHRCTNCCVTIYNELSSLPTHRGADSRYFALSLSLSLSIETNICLAVVRVDLVISILFLRRRQFVVKSVPLKKEGVGPSFVDTEGRRKREEHPCLSALKSYPGSVDE